MAPLTRGPGSVFFLPRLAFAGVLFCFVAPGKSEQGVGVSTRACAEGRKSGIVECAIERAFKLTETSAEYVQAACVNEPCRRSTGAASSAAPPRCRAAADPACRAGPNLGGAQTACFVARRHELLPAARPKPSPSPLHLLAPTAPRDAPRLRCCPPPPCSCPAPT